MSMQAVDKENAAVQLAVEEERRRVKEARAKAKKRLEKGPKMRCEFNNNEDPPEAGQPTPVVRFFYEGVEFKVRHGEIVEWPEEVVTHVNNLKTPVYRDEADPITGAIKSVPAGHVRRFTCLPLAEPRGGIGRTAPPKKEELNV